MTSALMAQTPTDIVVLQGLSPVAALSKTPEGRAALSANFTVTGGLQTGLIAQATLTSTDEQRQQALRDAAITYGNAAQLADGLGTTLEAAYVARAHYSSPSQFTNATQSVADLLALTLKTSNAHSAMAKNVFANGTLDGTKLISVEAKSIFERSGGMPDPFGRAYHLPAGSLAGSRLGDARPFQTEPELRRITGRDYYNLSSDNVMYTRGPIMDLTNSPSYPSGHTTYGYTAALTLGLLVPERYPQMIVRAAEYGNSRILVGAHYAMDVLGGRTLALYDMAHLLADDPAFLQAKREGDAQGSKFSASLQQARGDLQAVLANGCGKPVAQCAVEDVGRFSDPGAAEAFYASTQTYGLPVVHKETAATIEDVYKVAPEAGYLLTAAYPSLTLQEADAILTRTEGPGGGFLDDGSSFGLYSRLNLYKAAQEASLEANRAVVK